MSTEPVVFRSEEGSETVAADTSRDPGFSGSLDCFVICSSLVSLAGPTGGAPMVASDTPVAVSKLFSLSVMVSLVSARAVDTRSPIGFVKMGLPVFVFSVAEDVSVGSW